MPGFYTALAIMTCKQNKAYDELTCLQCFTVTDYKLEKRRAPIYCDKKWYSKSHMPIKETDGPPFVGIQMVGYKLNKRIIN